MFGCLNITLNVQMLNSLCQWILGRLYSDVISQPLKKNVMQAW